MRIAAVLCWYDEPIVFLKRLVASLAGVVDELVAVDGRWKPFPADRDLSPLAQQLAIERAATRLRLPLHSVSGAPFESQIAKRAYAMELAGGRADWLLVIDGDEYVAERAPAEIIRARLALAEPYGDYSVAAVTLLNVAGDDHRDLARPWRRLFRAGTTVTGWHAGYTRGGVDLETAPAVDLTHDLVIHHTPRSRGRERDQAAREYRHRRACRAER